MLALYATIDFSVHAFVKSCIRFGLGCSFSLLFGTILLAQSQQKSEEYGFSQALPQVLPSVQHELTITIGFLPAWKIERGIQFRAIDEAPPSLRDTLNSDFLARAAFGELGFTLRYGIVIADKFSVSLAASPYFGSFASEREKKDRIYGAQLDFTAGYRLTFGRSLSESVLLVLEPSCRVAYTFGGYSLGYFAGAKKEWLQFGDTKFYDTETAFHLIDNNLGIAPALKASWDMGFGIMAIVDLAWMVNLSRQTVFNIAGLGKDKQSVEWLQKPLTNDTIRFLMDGKPVQQSSIHDMFGFTRLTVSIGLAFRL